MNNKKSTYYKLVISAFFSQVDKIDFEKITLFT